MTTQFKKPHYFEVYGSIPASIHLAFKVYRSGQTIYFVSLTSGNSIIGIDLVDIEATIEENNTFILITKMGRVVLFSGGQIFAQYYSQIYN